MAKHMVKCAVCGQSFDTNSIQAVRHGKNRYAHLTCEPNNKNLIEMIQKEVEPKELTELKRYISDLFGSSNVNWALVMKQIKQFVDKDGYSYSGIQKSLKYFYEIKKNPKDRAYTSGLAIVPFCYKNAYDYYYDLFLAKQNLEEKSFTTKEEVIVIQPPHMRGLKQKLFDLGELENEE